MADLSRPKSAILPDGVWEIPGSRTESYQQLECSMHVEYGCDWHERYEKAGLLSILTYDAPIDYFRCYFPAWVSNIAVTGLKEGGTLPQEAPTTTEPLQSKDVNRFAGTGHEKLPQYSPYTYAKLAVDYKAKARPNPWSITETLTPEIGMRQIPIFDFYWMSDGGPILDAEAPGMQTVQAKIQRQIKGVRAVPDWFFSLEGRSNSNVWTDVITKISYARGTLLFQPSSMQRTITFSQDNDDSLWDFAFVLAWNPVKLLQQSIGRRIVSAPCNRRREQRQRTNRCVRTFHKSTTDGN